MKKLVTFIIGIVILMSSIFLNWLIATGLVKVLSLCFGFTFSFKVANGIWLVILILKSMFEQKKEK